VLAGIIISGGLLPNMNKGASPVVQTITSSLPPGVIHGYMGRPTGLPTIGAAVVAAVVAAEQQTGYTVNSIASIDGQYFFTLPQGNMSYWLLILMEPTRR